MLRLAFIVLFFFTALTSANEPKAMYQIDLIVFTHEQNFDEVSLKSTLSPITHSVIPLKTDPSKELTPFHLLPFAFSQLKEEYWALHRKPQYRILLNYSWLQPLQSKQTVLFPTINRDGFQLEGNISIQRQNYYVLNAELLLTNLNTNQNPFVFLQKQRLKGGEIYYFDHPQVGMLIKIHSLG